MRKTRHRLTPPISPGFTLIEVVIALSLSVILISAIYSAVSLHWRFEEVGRERIDRAQVSLAVLRLMSEDIGSVVFTPPSDTSQEEEETAAAATAAASGTSTGGSSSTSGSSTSSGTTSGSTSTTTATTQATTAATTTDSTQASLGIVGTADQLQLDISQPAREDFVPDETDATTGAATPGATAPAISDNVRVTWGLVTPTSAPKESHGHRSLTVNPALARQMVDRLRGTVEVDEDAQTNVTLSDASILAREIVSLQFRYYDGYSWVTEWDSVTSGRLPRAIEVTIGFIKSEYKPSGSLNLPGQVTIIPIKHVILVPASSPITGEEI